MLEVAGRVGWGGEGSCATTVRMAKAVLAVCVRTEGAAARPSMSDGLVSWSVRPKRWSEKFGRTVKFSLQYSIPDRHGDLVTL